jgi:hypothetical protein
VVFGTGAFAARIVFDLAASAAQSIRVVIAGRNRERLAWLATASAARAVIFARPAAFVAQACDLLDDDQVEAVLGTERPSVVVQAASVQTSSVIAATGDAWSRLVAEGGLSATAVFQAALSTRVAAAMTRLGTDARLVNCSFPDVVNPMIAALGHQVSCGIGNVAILANVFAAQSGVIEPGRLKVLGHYQTIAPWRRPPEARSGPAPRVFIDEAEIADVFARFRAARLTPEPAIEISGASGVPLMLAMANGRDWSGHVPGPRGLPGGYPVRLTAGEIVLDLPPSLTRDAAIAWNLRYEQESGLVVGPDGRATYTGTLRERLAAFSPDLAAGFHVGNLDDVSRATNALRAKLEGELTPRQRPHNTQR